MSKSKQAAKSVAIIIIFTICSKVLGFIREMLIAAKFGSDARTDTFFIAVTAISLFTSMITKSINTTMIPVLSEIEAKEGKDGKKSHTNNLLNIIFIMSIVIIILAWILAPVIIKVLASGFTGSQYRLAVLMMRIGLPTILFASIQGTFRGYLHSELMFTESAITNFPFNFVYIFFLLFLSNIFGIKGLMVTSVLAVVSQIIIQIPGVRSTGFRYEFILDFKDKYVRRIIYLVPPILVSAGISDINRIIDRSLASTLVDGSISALNYANKLDGLTTGIFISALATVLYPMLSEEANKETYDGLKKVMIRGINIVLLITIPAMVGMIILANPIVRVAFERGAFDSTATHMTVGALIFYSIGLVGSALRTISHRVFYSLQDTKTPMKNSFTSVIINVILNFILINFMAHRGLALATSISVNLTALLILYRLRKKIGPFGFMNSIKCGLKSLISAAVMGVVVYFLNIVLAKNMGSGLVSEFIALVVSAGVGATIYFALIYLFKIEEVDWVIKLARERLNKLLNRA